MTADQIVTTTARILRSATDLFSCQAYADVSVDRIAEQAGVTKMTVYQHFRSKDNLALECLLHRLKGREEALDRVVAQRAPGSDPLLAIFDWLEEWLDPARFRGCSFVKAVNELSAALPEVREIARDAKQQICKRFTALAKQAGRERPAEVGQQLALLFEGAQTLAFIESSAQPARVAKRMAKRLLQKETE